jgi:hypothetical protein
MHALVHFDLPTAFGMNPLLFVAAPLLGLLALRVADALPTGVAHATRLVANGWFWGALVVGFGVLRNLRWAPVAWMAPG